MVDVLTPNIGLTKPDVGASDDTWGDKLNSNFDILDALGGTNASKAYVDTQDALHQPIDPTLSALATLDGVVGLVEQTGPDAFTKRAIGIAPASAIPTVSLADARYAALIHSHIASNISDFSEAVDDRVAALLVAGTGVTFVYNDPANTITVSAQDATRVLKAGDTMTGDLTITKDNPRILLNKTGNLGPMIIGEKNGLNRWLMSFANSTAESGANVGSDFVLVNYDDAGNQIGTPITIVRSTGLMLVAGDPTVALGAATKQYVDTPDALRVRVDTAAQGLTAAQQANARANISAALKGHLFGLTLSNNGSDATNDIDIAAGEAASTETNPVLMVLASALTKRLDAAWAVGTNQGGLDTGAIADTTYHKWLIQRSDTGVVDALFSASASAPTMPTNYDRKRRIGSIIRIGGAIKSFVQDNDLFRWFAPVVDANAINPGTSAVTRTLTVPTGLRVQALLTVGYNDTGGNGPGTIYVSDLSVTDIAPLIGNATVTFRVDGITYTSGTTAALGYAAVMTNTSAQVRHRVQFSTATIAVTVLTQGWVDTRGRLA